MTEAVAERAGSQSQLAGKYLTFVLSKEEYGIDILRVQEIIGLIETTPLPRMPREVRGVVNLRGKIIPVIDLRLKFGMPQAAETSFTCIVVVDLELEPGQFRQMGCVVDSVSEVMLIDEAQVESAPRCAKVNSEFVLGLGNTEDKIVILLDIERIFRSVEVCGFGEQTAGGGQ